MHQAGAYFKSSRFWAVVLCVFISLNNSLTVNSTNQISMHNAACGRCWNYLVLRVEFAASTQQDASDASMALSCRYVQRCLPTLHSDKLTITVKTRQTRRHTNNMRSHSINTNIQWVMAKHQLNSNWQVLVFFWGGGGRTLPHFFRRQKLSL